MDKYPIVDLQNHQIVFDFLKNFCTVFCNDYTNIHSRHWCVGIFLLVNFLIIVCMYDLWRGVGRVHVSPGVHV